MKDISDCYKILMKLRNRKHVAVRVTEGMLKIQERTGVS